MNRFLVSAFLLSTLFVSSCKKDAIEVTNPTEAPTFAHGAPAAAAASKTIGPEGGSLSLPDGTVALTIPAGAVTKATTFSIQPVENTLPGSRGESFRLLPEGTEFAKPVTLRFSYRAFPLDGTIPEALFLAYQNAEGRYSLVDKTQLDKATQTLTVETTHFSDWQICETFRVVVDKTRLKRGEKATLKLQELDLIADLTRPDIQEWTDNVAVTGSMKMAWSLVGEGKIAPAGTQCVYTAPAATPARNPILVNLTLSGFDVRLLRGRVKPSSLEMTLITPIDVSEGALTVTFKGGTYTFNDLQFDDSTLPWKISAGTSDKNYLYIHLNDHRKGDHPFGPWHSQVAGLSTIRYQFGDKEYASDKGWCTAGNRELVNEGSVIIEEYVRGKYIKGRFSGTLSDMDDPACSAGGPAISGKFEITQ